MAKNNIISDLNDIIRKNNINAKITEKNLKDDLKIMGIDSLTAMNIVISIEEKYNIQLPDDQLMKLKTPKDLIETIEKTMKK